MTAASTARRGGRVRARPRAQRRPDPQCPHARPHRPRNLRPGLPERRGAARPRPAGLDEGLLVILPPPVSFCMGNFYRLVRHAPVRNDRPPSCVRRPGASPSGFDLVGLTADLVTPARWATIGGQCTAFVTALETVPLSAGLGIRHAVHPSSRYACGHTYLSQGCINIYTVCSHAKAGQAPADLAT